MKKLLTALIVMAAGCAEIPQSKIPASADSNFAKLSGEFLSGYLAWRPATGTTLGLHKYDGKLTDFSRASVSEELTRLRRFNRELAALRTSSLSPQSLQDYRVLRTAIADELFAFEDLQSYTRNPMTYAGALDLSTYIKRDFAPLEQRMHSIISIEKETPRLMAAARANLDASLA